jgi:hypothetical protein
MPLRDAVILSAGCFCGVVLLRCLDLSGFGSSTALFLTMLGGIALSGPLCFLASRFLSPATRSWLALALAGTSLLSLVFFIGMRA